MNIKHWQAFREIRKRSKYRGIDFHFSFEEWVAWWEKHLGIDWFEKRGRKKGQYVMARKEDKGSYISENVKCITCGSNVKEAARKRADFRGEKHPGAKLNSRDIITIFNSSIPNKALAKQYGVNADHIGSIKRRRVWKHITIGL